MASNIGFLNEVVFNHTKAVIDERVAGGYIPEEAAPDEQDILFTRAMRFATGLFEDGSGITEIQEALGNRWPISLPQPEIIMFMTEPEYPF